MLTYCSHCSHSSTSQAAHDICLSCDQGRMLACGGTAAEFARLRHLNPTANRAQPTAGTPPFDPRSIRVVIDHDTITVSMADDALPIVDRSPDLHFTCRTAAQEVLAWASSRIGEELRKSVAFYRTGEPTDCIILTGPDTDD